MSGVWVSTLKIRSSKYTCESDTWIDHKFPEPVTPVEHFFCSLKTSSPSNLEVSSTTKQCLNLSNVCIQTSRGYRYANFGSTAFNRPCTDPYIVSSQWHETCNKGFLIAKSLMPYNNNITLDP